SNFNYIKNRSLRILPPYIIWSIIFYIISIIISNGNFSIFRLIYGILFGTSLGIGYFVIVLMQLVFITLLIKNIEKKKTHILIMFFISILGLLYTYSTKIFIPDHFVSRFPYSALPFFIWYPFYHFGFYLSKFQPQINYSINSLAI